MTITVRDNPAASRYEALIDGELAGFATYEAGTQRVVVTHTEVDPEFGGRGVGSTLVREALDDIRRRGLSVTPICPFFAKYIREHREYVDLVDEAHRAQFESG